MPESHGHLFEEEMLHFLQNPIQSLLYNQINSASGVNTLKEIIDEAKKYEINDLLSKVSSLNLIIENQNKGIYFDSLIAALISQPLSVYSSKKIIRTKELRKLISQIEKTGLSFAIDPPEVLFIDRVRFYDNYWIFPGNNYTPAFIIQNFIDALIFNEKIFDPVFFQIALHIINFVLTLSNDIANALEYGYHTQRKAEKKYVQIPNYEEIHKYASTLVFDLDKILSILKIDTADFLFIDFAETKLDDILASDNQQFYQHPFIKINDKKCVLLNPTILIPFAIHQIILEASRFGQKDTLLNLYNENNWKVCKEALYSLGHKKIKEESIGICLFSSDSYKESLFSVGYNSILWVSFYCDNGKDYSNTSMFGVYEIHGENIPNQDHIDEIERQLEKNRLACSGYITILCSFGRQISTFNIHATKENALKLDPSELRYISINERRKQNYLPQYIKAKSMIKDTFSSTLSELNAIEVYDSNHCSFYLDDSVQLSSASVFFVPGDSLSYIARATAEEDRRLIDASDGIHLEDVILSDKLRKIYTPISIKKQIKYVVPTKNNIIWFLANMPISVEEYNIIRSLIDAISFWLAECRNIVDSLAIHERLINIRVILSGDISQYKQLQNEIDDLSAYLSYKNDDKSIIMEWTPQAYQYTRCSTNSHEKEIILSLFKQLERRGSKPINLQAVSEAFKNTYKKKFFSFNVSDFPYYKPIWGQIPSLSFQFRDELLDTVGEYIMGNYKIVGTIPDTERTKVSNDIVGFLYSLLQQEVAKLQPDGLYETLCYDLEVVLYNMLVSRSRYIYDVACYPERKKQYIDENNSLNEISVSLKFFLEYIAACPPSGNQPIDELQYARLLTLCSEIINWAYKNDLFFYHSISSPISLLGSGRVGIERNEIDYFAALNSSAMEVRLRNESDPSIERFHKSGILKKYIDQLDEAFSEEYGFMLHEMLQCVDTIIYIGDSIKGDVKKVSYGKLIEQIHSETGLVQSKIRKIISIISLTKREDFLVPPNPYTKEDVYPWRFNREISFTRRPMIIIDASIIWGNRQLFHMSMYIIDIIENGKFKARSNKLKTVIGKINNERGNQFNEKVVDKLRSIKGIIARGKVSKINKKRIEDEKKNTLGDIDVLCIIPKYYSIIAFEVKDFSFAKNPYEMEQEYKRMFVDGDKICFTTKHKRRVDWLQKHMSDTIYEFDLKPGKWKVLEAYIVNEDIISNKYHKRGKNILLYSMLNEESIKAILKKHIGNFF